ncbi:MAG: proton-conducting transporter membrane subunit [Nitrospirales bacterium]
MMWPIILLIGTPFLIGVSGLVVRNRQTFDVLHCMQAGIMIISSLLLVDEVSVSGPVSFLVFLRVDAMSAWFDLVIGIVAGTGTLYAVGYVGEQYDRGHVSLKRFRHFFILFDLYLGVMLLAINVENLGMMWIAIEGATLSAALLIGFERSKGALEAGWKFVILSSVGIALALFGTILVYYSSEQLLGITEEALHWAKLYEVGDQLDPSAMKIAFIFILVGYGTKAGLVPMHTWLPDAHGEAPTPVSAMLSANMLTMAIYAILRFKILTDQAVGPEFTGTLLIGFGFFCVVLSAIFLLLQEDFKRLLAYSSIEHIGIALIGFGLGGLGVFGGLWHLLNHALAKSAAFYGAGLVLLTHEHKFIARVPGLLRQHPVAGVALIVTGLVLAGMPPFGLFVSEISIAADAISTAPSVAYGFLSILTLAFATLLFQVLRMILGVPMEGQSATVGRRCRAFSTAAIAMNLGALFFLGLHVPSGLQDLLGLILPFFHAEGEYF